MTPTGSVNWSPECTSLLGAGGSCLRTRGILRKESVITKNRSAIVKPWNQVRKAAGVEDVRLHDLRRTVGSWLAQSGDSLHLIGRVLSHSNQSTTGVYARFGEDSVRAALEQHGARIMGVAGVSPTAPAAGPYSDPQSGGH
ncbi:tyrosine-type recombinase/integrase [Thioalkalicoccus limnaeus]|uniref:Tyrosine-type recombinase/integrase n=1 Tax=Thioalkalicoccus limnaeus TaxID=120681 RepID=A0ABV4BHN9_9GAMM